MYRKSMIFIQNNEDLQALCLEMARKPFIAIDTEFIRERTFWPELCLIQLASDGVEACIDAYSDIDMACFGELLNNASIVKVFHSSRQDLEIFYNMFGRVPLNIFDTQIAAMACGLEEMCSYQKLVSSFLGITLDKGQRFTDWSHRPLTDKQLRYALNDVIYLRDIYKIMISDLTKRNRIDWIRSDMEALSDDKIYRIEPEDAWKRIKTHICDKEFLGVLKEVAKWRELEAMKSNRPRKLIMKDEVLLEISSCRPSSKDELASMRGVPRGFAESRHGVAILQAVKRGMENPVDDLMECTHNHVRRHIPQGLPDMLKLLLNIKASEANVAPHLIASASDLEEIACNTDNADTKILSGWRYDIFGRYALALCHGRISISYDSHIKKVILLSNEA